MSFFAEAIQRGTRGSQPAAASVVIGTLYYVTDEGVTERSTGAAWEDFTDFGTPDAMSVSGWLLAQVFS